MSELSGQVAIVTGGASGIGAATVALLAEAGAAVVVADIQPAAKEAPGRFVKHDVASEDSWKALLADVLGRNGRLDIVVNNAGITGGWGTIETTTVEQWRRIEAVDSEGVFLGCKYAIEGMKKTGAQKAESKGSIVNVSSVAALIGSAGPTAYCAAKGAVVNLTRSLAVELAPRGVRVNAVAPSLTTTDATADIPDSDRAEFIKRIPMGRAADPSEVADVIAFLAGFDARCVTGVVLPVDGGLRAGSGQPPHR